MIAAATYVEQVGAYLHTLYAHCRLGIARASADESRGYGVSAANPLPQMPGWLVDELTAGETVVRIATATTAPTGAPLRDFGAAWCEIPIALMRARNGALVPEAGSVGAAFQRLADFACRPPIVIDAGASVFGVWPLARPLDLAGDGLAHAEALQRRLADVLGGRTDDVTIADVRSAQPGGPITRLTLAACSPVRPALPVPGSRARGEMDLFVDFAAFEPRRVDLEDLRAALDGGRAKRKGHKA